MTAGASGTILTNPLWVVKTRFMTQDARDGDVRYRHTWDALIRIYREEGPRAFYRGMLPSLFGVAHVAVQFPLYERFKVLSRESGQLAPTLLGNGPADRRHGARCRTCGWLGYTFLDYIALLICVQDDCFDRDLPARGLAHATADSETPPGRCRS